MNDFTKEELKYLLNELRSTNVRQIHSFIIDKIQLMIENYCEHKLEDWWLLDHNQKICIKCDTIMHKA